MNYKNVGIKELNKIMKVEDLRIRNYVECKTVNGCKIGQIEHLSGDFFMAVIDGKTYGQKYGQFKQCIEPILLTEEILLKCGFRKDKSGFYRYDNYNDSISIKVGSSYTFIEYANLCFNPEDVTETNYSSSLEFPNQIHLHTLQNIWNLLTGKELEIKL